MPAISSQDGWTMELERREWKNTVGQSGMTPTAFAFLIPVFVVVVFCPFLCVFCIRRRQRTIPIPRVRPQKKPSLRREEARQRLALVTDVVGATEKKKEADTVERKEDVADTASVSERECAICLCSLHAPSPPEPALIASQSTVDEATLPTPQPTSTTATTTTPPTTTADPAATDASIIPPDPSILKLHICAHEFHASCLVSWFVLRKTTCPICRAAYISKEDFAAYEDEEAEAVGATTVEQMGVVDPPVIVGRHVIGVPGGFTGEGRRIRAPGTEARVSNWRYFWRGEGVWGGRGAGQSQAQVQGQSGETQTPTQTPGMVEEGGVARQQPQSTWRRMVVQGM